MSELRDDINKILIKLCDYSFKSGQGEIYMDRSMPLESAKATDQILELIEQIIKAAKKDGYIAGLQSLPIKIDEVTLKEHPYLAGLLTNKESSEEEK